MRIVLVANTGWYLVNFRGNLLRALKAAGHEIVLVSPRDEYVIKLEQIADRWHEWSIDRKGTGLGMEFHALKQLEAIYKRERPEVVHHFTIKPILYGTTAARRAGVRRIVNSVTGLGHAFLAESGPVSWLRPAVRRWYLRSLIGADVTPMFQNRDDLKLLSADRMELFDHAVFTPGSGVDLRRFQPVGEHEEMSNPIDHNRVLFVGRLLREKGVVEFVEAARQLRNEGFQTEFALCGDADPGNPSAVDSQWLEESEQCGIVRCLGHVGEIEREFQSSDLVVLPSYREGMPRVLLEAGACGLPAVATDVPGCRDVIQDGITGHLVPARNSGELAVGIRKLLEDRELRRKMGSAALQRVRSEFDDRIVLDQTTQTYRGLFKEHELNDEEQFLRKFSGGVMTISLDFELAWGTRGRPSAATVGDSLDGTRAAVAGLLDLLQKYGVSATWASVGALWMGRSTSSKHPWLSGSEFNDVPAGDSKTHPHWYAEDLLDQLRSCAVPQEIGCHTLTHLFVDPGSRGREPLRLELERFRELFEELYLPPAKTLIFPKAYMGHLDLLAELGFEAYRGPENKWFESLPGTLPAAALRLLDARLGRPPVVERPRHVARRLWMIPSSQFYSPFMSVGRRVRLEDRVRKGIRGLRRAVENRGVYHLWTHPFNLGVRTKELLAGIEQILREAVRLRDQGRLEIISMGEIASRLNTDWPAALPEIESSGGYRSGQVGRLVTSSGPVSGDQESGPRSEPSSPNGHGNSDS